MQQYNLDNCIWRLFQNKRALKRQSFYLMSMIWSPSNKTHLFVFLLLLLTLKILILHLLLVCFSVVNMLCLSMFLSISQFLTRLSAVYLDQRMGGLHHICWLKYSVFSFFFAVFITYWNNLYYSDFLSLNIQSKKQKRKVIFLMC